jgi:hypothetical protein
VEQSFDRFDDLRPEIGERHAAAVAKGVGQPADLPSGASQRTKSAPAVTGAVAKGTWVRIVHPTAEGKVVRGYKGLDVGDHWPCQMQGSDVMMATGKLGATITSDQMIAGAA